MNTEIKVHVVDYNRRVLYMRYRDPLTGKHIAKSARTSNRQAAQKEAGKWEDDLREGRYKAPSKVTWGEFRRRYEDEAFDEFAEATQRKYLTVFKQVEAILSLDKLASLTTERLNKVAKTWRDEKKSEHTIKSRLALLRSALNWAHDAGMLVEVPKFNMPKRAKGAKLMKGRPITTEEFERMLAVVPKCVRANVEQWQRLLRGLFFSGLRLGEALDLWWDRTDRMHIKLGGKYPMFRIHAGQEKGGQDRLLPLTPDFAEFILATPEADRHGRVFNMPCRGLTTVSDVISRFGERAGVKVNTSPQTGVVKYASAHDLRRSFGDRWAKRIMPTQLMALMRHADIQTTLRYYVGQDAEATADLVWAAMQAPPEMKPTRPRKGNSAGNTPAKPR